MKVSHPLKHVLDLPHQDASVYEHRRTGERRTITGKARASFGIKAAWDKATPKSSNQSAD
jgi:hypothetical protein